jgi:hypothetical protein
MYEIKLRPAGGTGVNNDYNNNQVSVKFTTNSPDFVLTVGQKDYRFSVENDNLVIAGFNVPKISVGRDYNNNPSLKLCKD